MMRRTDYVHTKDISNYEPDKKLFESLIGK